MWNPTSLLSKQKKRKWKNSVFVGYTIKYGWSSVRESTRNEGVSFFELDQTINNCSGRMRANSHRRPMRAVCKRGEGWEGTSYLVSNEIGKMAWLTELRAAYKEWDRSQQLIPYRENSKQNSASRDIWRLRKNKRVCTIFRDCLHLEKVNVTTEDGT